MFVHSVLFKSRFFIRKFLALYTICNCVILLAFSYVPGLSPSVLYIMQVFCSSTPSFSSHRYLHSCGLSLHQFHSKDEEFFSVPHWINYSFYSSTRGRVQRRFQPRIYLSDHLVFYSNHGTATAVKVQAKP